MRPFNRADLGRLYVSPAGAGRYTYLGDASLDGVASSAQVAYDGRSFALPSTGAQWTGAVTARSGEAFLALTRQFGEVDLLVTYGDEYCSPTMAGYATAMLVEGAVVTGEAWSALSGLSSGQRAPVAATCQFSARGLRRLRAGDALRRHAQLSGTVAALHRDGGRLYALCAVPSGGGTAILLRLAWSDNALDWTAAPITYGAFAEPTSYGLTYGQFAVHAWAGRVYIATGADLLCVTAPRAGEAPAALYATAVRAPGKTTAPVVGLRACGGALHALTTSGVWRIAPDGGIAVITLLGSSYRHLRPSEDGLLAHGPGRCALLGPDGALRRYVIWGGGDLAMMREDRGRLLAITAGGGVWVDSGSGWSQLADLPNVLAAASAGPAAYALVAAGSRGTRLVAALGDWTRWVNLDTSDHDGVCLLPLGDGVLVGGQDLATSAPRGAGLGAITRCRATGLIWTAASSELLIAA